MKKYFSILILALLFLNSCKTSKSISLAMVGDDYKHVKEFFTGADEHYDHPDVKLYEKTDSLVVISTLNHNPFEAIFLFENDTCFFQRLSVYCSPCADVVVDGIVKDEDYNFEVVDPVNYISTRDGNIVMRLKEKIDKQGNCNEITIYKIKEN